MRKAFVRRDEQPVGAYAPTHTQHNARRPTKNEVTYAGSIWRRGDKTLLTPIEKTDLPFFQVAVNNAEVQRFIIVNWPLSEVGQLEWFERISRPNPNKFTVGIRLLDGTLIGNMSLEIDEGRQSGKTGTLIGTTAHRGQGYGTDAKLTLLRYAFHERGLRRVDSPIIGYNRRSRKYAKACGYEFVCRNPGVHFRFGKWRSEVLYTAWRERWLKFERALRPSK